MTLTFDEIRKLTANYRKLKIASIKNFNEIQLIFEH